MIRIGILGTIGSGKSYVANNLGYPVFDADYEVTKLYKKNKKIFLKLKKILPKNIKSFPIEKKEITEAILQKKSNLKKIIKIVHTEVRKKMNFFLKKNKNKKLLFLEIPLLVESKLTKYFDLIIFIKSKLQIRKKRYILKKGDPLMFDFLNNHQFKDSKKIRHCDHIVVNNRSLSILKKNLLNIMKKL